MESNVCKSLNPNQGFFGSGTHESIMLCASRATDSSLFLAGLQEGGRFVFSALNHYKPSGLCEIRTHL